VTRTRLERAGEVAARAGSLRPADPRVRRGLHIGIGLIVVLSVGLAAFAATGDLPDVDWRLRPAALVLAALGLGLFLVANAEIWRRILRALGPITFLQRTRKRNQSSGSSWWKRTSSWSTVG